MNNNFENTLNKEENSNHERLNDLNDAINSTDPSNDDFDSEAAEGLQQIAGNKIPLLVNQINGNLKSQLKNKKKSKKKNSDQSTVIITIITLLIIIVVAYIIIKKFYQ